MHPSVSRTGASFVSVSQSVSQFGQAVNDPSQHMVKQVGGEHNPLKLGSLSCKSNSLRQLFRSKSSFIKASGDPQNQNSLARGEYVQLYREGPRTVNRSTVLRFLLYSQRSMLYFKFYFYIKICSLTLC